MNVTDHWGVRSTPGPARPCELLGGLEQHPTAIADYAVAQTGGVAGIAQIKPGDGQAATPRDDQQSAQRHSPARAIGSERIRVEALDRVGGPAVGCLTRAIIEMVREVRRDHDQRFGSAPERVEQRRHRLRWRIAGNDRHQGELAQRRLQEW